MRLLLACLLLSAPARAAFQEAPLDARAAGMADALTADPAGLAGAVFNPAALGQIRGGQALAGARRLFHLSAGSADLSGMALGAAAPLTLGESRGALGAYWTHDRNGSAAVDRTLALTYATRSWRELETGTLDVGATFKLLSRSGRDFSGGLTKAAADLGAYYRLSEDQAVGVSLLNVNGPELSLEELSDSAPTTFRIGYVRRVRRFTAAMDFSKRERSADSSAREAGALALEHGWGTAQHGTFSARSGLILADVGRSWSLGGGWSGLGARLDYAMRLPLSGEKRVGHVVSLSYRFGSWDPETEYERLLSSELRYRRDLASALDRAREKQTGLEGEIERMRGEMEELRRELALREAQLSPTEEKLKEARRQLKLKELEERRRSAQERLKALREEQERLRRLDQEGLLAEEWAAYQKLKSQGVSDAALVERVQAILREYQGRGVDLSEAQRELQRLRSR